MNGNGKPSGNNAIGDLGSLGTRLFCMLMPGRIFQADYDAGKVRIRCFPGTKDQIETEWMPWFVPRSAGTNEWNPPEVGEGGMVFSPSGRLNNGRFFPGLNYEDFPFVSNDPDEHKIVYLNERVGLYSYHRRKGVKRWRVHSEGQYRHEVGIFEDTGDERTSDIIQDKNHIQLRVGKTRLVLRDGSLRLAVAGQTSEFSLDAEGLTARVGENTLFKMRDGEVSAAIMGSKVGGDEGEKDVKSSLVMTDAFTQLAFGENAVVRVTDQGLSAEMREEEARLTVSKNGILAAQKESRVLVQEAIIDIRNPGSRLTVAPELIIIETPNYDSYIPSTAVPVPYKAGAFKPFGVPTKAEEMVTLPPAVLTTGNKPYMPA